MSDIQTMPDTKAGDHVSAFYDSPGEMWQLLTEYYRQGLAQRELCVLVTNVTPQQASEQLLGAGLDVQSAVRDGDLQIVNMLETYLPKGRFVADVMLQSINDYIETAKTQGYTGLRIAGEMTWLLERPTFLNEAADYEGDVNHIGDRHPEFTGLCLYAIRPGSVGAILNAVRKHPEFIYKGQLHMNPYYLAPERFMKFLAADPLPAASQRKGSSETALQELFTHAALA